MIHESHEFQEKRNEDVRKKLHVQVLGIPPRLLENKLEGLGKNTEKTGQRILPPTIIL